MRETWKGFHRKQDPPANQNQTRGHDVCHAAIKQSMQSRTPSATTTKKKKKKKEAYIYAIYVYIHKQIVKYVHLYNNKQTFSYSYDRPKHGWPQE